MSSPWASGGCKVATSRVAARQMATPLVCIVGGSVGQSVRIPETSKFLLEGTLLIRI